MSCRRVSRELLERFRFGDLDSRHAGHLEHLERCESCRGEVGLDQALVHQLQRALRARVEGPTPSPAAWSAIRARALAEPPPSFMSRLLRLSSPVRGLVVVGMLAIVAVFSGGQLSTLNRSSQDALAPQSVEWRGFVEAASIPPQQTPQARPLSLGLVPPPRASGVTKLADPSANIGSLPRSSEPAPRFFQ